jgi:hypothetical protein
MGSKEWCHSPQLRNPKEPKQNIFGCGYFREKNLLLQPYQELLLPER